MFAFSPRLQELGRDVQGMEGGKEEWEVIVYLMRLQRACRRRPLRAGSFYFAAAYIIRRKRPSLIGFCLC